MRGRQAIIGDGRQRRNGRQGRETSDKETKQATVIQPLATQLVKLYQIMFNRNSVIFDIK